MERARANRMRLGFKTTAATTRIQSRNLRKTPLSTNLRITESGNVLREPDCVPRNFKQKHVTHIALRPNIALAKHKNSTY
jgi:hypothetical protein